MNMIKSLILSSAAGLIAVGGAQAADLPVKAKAVEYVKICSLYGAGFYYIPGTDTCIQIGGYVRADTSFNVSASSGTQSYSGDTGIQDRYVNKFVSRARLQVNIDTRTATEYGVLRTFGSVDNTFTTLGGGSSTPNNLSNNTSASPVLDTAGGGTTQAEMLFLQFAGFTFGRSLSAYASPWSGYPGNNANSFFGGDNYLTAGTLNGQYTAQFGNGVSATIGLDDPAVQSRTNIYNLSTGLSVAGTTGSAYAGTRMPDVSANVKIDQAWGLFQLSGQLHEIDASYNTLTGGQSVVPTNASASSGHPDSKYGGAVMAALDIKNIPTGPGDDIKFSATYAKGDTKQVISGPSTSPSFFMMKGATVGFGATTDALYTPVGTLGSTDGGLHLTTSYGFQGIYNHNWNAQWSSTLYGTQSWVKYDSTAQANYCAAYAVVVANPGSYSCNPNYTVSQIGSRTIWTPVKGLAFSAEVQWFHLGTGFSGFATLPATSSLGPYPSGVYSFKAQNTAFLQLRVQRNF